VSVVASMGSGRGDRNQGTVRGYAAPEVNTLQWGPVVVTGIRAVEAAFKRTYELVLQWGPVVVTGISAALLRHQRRVLRFNGVRSW